MNSSQPFPANDRLGAMRRFLLAVVVIFVVFTLTAVIVDAGFHFANIKPGLELKLFWQSVVSLALLLAAFKAMTNLLDRRPFGAMGMTMHRGWGRELNWGMTMTAVMVGIAVLLETLAGFAHFTLTNHPAISSGLFTVVLFAIAAAKEELVFRGYAFQRLVEAITPAGAIAVSSALFGAVHLANPHRTWISTFNTMLVGIPFCLAYLRTRSLWMPIGMHFIWNVLLGVVFGLPVSGFVLPSSLLTARVHGPVWLTGGAYGPEGGLFALLAIIAGICYLSTIKGIYISEEIKSLLLAPAASQEPPLTLFSTPLKEEAKRDS